MLQAKYYKVQNLEQHDDGIGGYIQNWFDAQTIRAYLDYMSGTDQNTIQNALVEDATHILITDGMYLDIDINMRITDDAGRSYQITFVDNPLNIDHHLEIYLKVSD